jgi:hypothetical protein
VSLLLQSICLRSELKVLNAAGITVLLSVSEIGVNLDGYLDLSDSVHE